MFDTVPRAFTEAGELTQKRPEHFQPSAWTSRCSPKSDVRDPGWWYLDYEISQVHHYRHRRLCNLTADIFVFPSRLPGNSRLWFRKEHAFVIYTPMMTMGSRLHAVPTKRGVYNGTSLYRKRSHIHTHNRRRSVAP